MLNFLKDYFSFSKSERNGIVILILLIFVLIIAPKLLPLFIKSKPIDFSHFKKEIQEFERQMALQTHQVEEEAPYLKDYFREYELFEFDPNNLSKEKWKLLGINDRTISIIKNYESKGGKFYTKADLKKIYGFKDSDYDRLEPYIRITLNTDPQKADNDIENQPFVNKQYVSKKYQFEDSFKIELNSADSLSLTRLRGIGKAFSSRIINYGNLLGGFVRKEQLLEVYGIDTVLFASIENKLIVDIGSVSKINVNRASIDELSKHPYIDYNVAKAVYNYRQQHGDYSKLEDLKKSYLVNDIIYDKIAPYLVVE